MSTAVLPRDGRREDASGRPTVTVLIPAHNEEEFVARTVRSCLDQTHRPESVIVIDDNSTDETASVAHLAGARVVWAPGGSRARALNVGLHHVTTDIVVITDADTLLTPTTVDKLVSTIEAGYDATCGALLPRLDQPATLTIRARWCEYTLARRWARPAQSAVRGMFVLSGGLGCFRTEVLQAAGGIPDSLGEDADLTWRLHGMGCRIRFTPNALAYTTDPETMRVYIGQVRRWAASSYQTIATHWRKLWHPGRLFVVAMSLWDILGAPLLFPIALIVSANRSLATVGIVSAWAVLLHAAAFTVIAYDLGLRKTLTHYPASMVVSWVGRWLYAWAFCREWVLGRHFTSWTGRQGGKGQVTPMPAGRRRVFTGSVAVVRVRRDGAGDDGCGHRSDEGSSQPAQLATTVSRGGRERARPGQHRGSATGRADRGPVAPACRGSEGRAETRDFPVSGAAGPRRAAEARQACRSCRRHAVRRNQLPAVELVANTHTNTHSYADADGYGDADKPGLTVRRPR